MRCHRRPDVNGYAHVHQWIQRAAVHPKKTGLIPCLCRFEDDTDETLCVLISPRVFGIDSIYIGPSFKPISGNAASEHGSRVVATASAQRRDLAVDGGADESRHDGHGHLI